MQKSASSAKNWPIGNEYEIKNFVGKGSYGQVASAVHRPSGKKVAIKKIDELFDDLTDCKRVLREIKLL